MVGTTRSRMARGAVGALSLMLALGVLAGCGKKQPEPSEPGAPPNDVSSIGGLTPAPPNAAEATSTFYEPSTSLQNVIKAAKTWDVSFRPWWGKIAPADFTLTDISGEVSTLSEYRGRNVMVVIWRTWNPTCKLQVPHLKELRTAFEDKDLAILAISDEPAAVVKEFATQEGINFTVLAGGADLPAPFGEVEYVPSSFFIDPQGRFKLAVRGLIPTGDAAAIIKAQ
jgi:peroxiredoxin